MAFVVRRSCAAIRRLIDQQHPGNSGILAAQVVGSLLIAAAARGDLWFDEIWSIVLVREAREMLDVFGIRHDNNHVLSSLYLWLLGTTAPPYVYRLLAVACGVGSLFVIARIARRWGRAEALASVILAGTSYPLLLYFSEARGYAPAMFLALVAYALVQDDARPAPARVVLFWVVSILGVLAHLTFVFVTAALLVIRRPRFVALHSVPLLFIGIFYFTFVRGMTFNARLDYRMVDIAAQVASLLIGTPEDWPSFVNVVAGVVIILGGATALRRAGDSQWLFYPALMLVAPLAGVLIMRPDFLYARYFVVTFPFFYLLLAWLICRCGRALHLRWAAGALIVVLVAAQSGRVWSLLAVGRGQYSRALADMSAATGARRLVLASDNDFRTAMILTFYAPRLRHQGGVVFVARKDWRTIPPEWFIAQTQDFAKRPKPLGRLAGGAMYVLVEEYPYSGISGWRWFLYRKAGPALDRAPTAQRVITTKAPSASRSTE